MFVFPVNDAGYRSRRKAFRACVQCKKQRVRIRCSLFRHCGGKNAANASIHTRTEFHVNQWFNCEAVDVGSGDVVWRRGLGTWSSTRKKPKKLPLATASQVEAWLTWTTKNQTLTADTLHSCTVRRAMRSMYQGRRTMQSGD